MNKYSIKEIFVNHWHSFVEEFSSIRPVVIKEVHKMMNCLLQGKEKKYMKF